MRTFWGHFGVTETVSLLVKLAVPLKLQNFLKIKFHLIFLFLQYKTMGVCNCKSGQIN